MKPIRAVIAGAVALLAVAGPARADDAADKLLVTLKAGNAHFAAGHLEHPHQDAARRAEVLGGQKPFATILSCSDSRVPAELAFDQGIGDLFIVRVAGNVADTDELGTVEYGVGHLETPLLVVMGHTKCGAVTAVATKAEVHDHIPDLVDNIAPAVEAARAKLPGAKDDEVVPRAIRENVFVSIADIITKSPSVRERLKSKKVAIVGALYHLDDGKVEWLGPHPDEAALVTKGDAQPAPAHGHDEKAAHAPEKQPAHGPAKPPKDPHAKEPEAAGHDPLEAAAHPPPHQGAPANLPTVLAIVAFVATIAGVVTGRLTSR